MFACKFVTVRESLPRRNKDGKQPEDPTKDLSFIPLLDSEFLYLLGLEEVVQFRVDLLDKIIFVPHKRGAKGKQKNSLSLVAKPARPPKDPFTCAQCNTDFSPSWKQDKKGSTLCWSCFQCSRWQEHRPSIGPKESHIRSTFGKFSSSVLTSTNHPVHSDPRVKQETSSFTVPLRGDQQVPKPSASRSSGQTCHPSLTSPSFYSDSSPSSSNVFSAPTDVFVRSPGDTSSSSLSSPSNTSSPCSSDLFSSPFYLPSDSGPSSPSDASSSLSLPSTSDLRCSSLSPSYSPHCTKN